MAKRSKKGRRAKKMTIPLSVAAPLGLAAFWTFQNLSRGDYTQVRQDFTGVGADNKFAVQNLMPMYAPLAAGIVVHKIAGKVGVNKVIAQAGIPFIRV